MNGLGMEDLSAGTLVEVLAEAGLRAWPMEFGVVLVEMDPEPVMVAATPRMGALVFGTSTRVHASGELGTVLDEVSPLVSPFRVVVSPDSEDPSIYTWDMGYDHPILPGDAIRPGMIPHIVRRLAEVARAPLSYLHSRGLVV